MTFIRGNGCIEILIICKDEREEISMVAVLVPSTVNQVIFAGGKFRENVGKPFHVGVIFTIFHIFP